ncbi:hypothetical protein GCM10027589_30250 [Actinocorallia lasiicapitis]
MSEPSAHAPDHPDLAVVARLYAGFAARDGVAARACFAADVTYVVPGEHPGAGVFAGRENVDAAVRALVKETGGTLRSRVVDMYVSGRGEVTVVNRATASRGGRELDVVGRVVYTIRDGLIIEMREQFDDLGTIHAFWS